MILLVSKHFKKDVNSRDIVHVTVTLIV